MSIVSKYIWFDGSLVPFEQANVHVLTHTLHYGMGAFEGIRAYEQPDGRPGIWRLREHIERLMHTAKMLRMPTPFDAETVQAACLEVLKANEYSNAYLRPLLFLGTGQMGLGARNNPTHTVVAAWQWGAYLGDEAMQNGIQLQTSSFQRNHPNAAMPRAKVVGHYVNSILARYEANENGFDEALMLDVNGFVAEGTGENLFVVSDGIVYTPPATNILPGITRKTVIEMLHAEGTPVVEQCFGRDLLYTADEVFMCGTAAEITPVAALDRRTVGAGSPGPITRRIQSGYLAAVRGEVPSMAHHITTPSPS